MRKHFAIDEFADLLLYPERWRIVSSDYQSPDVQEIKAPDYALKQVIESHENTCEIMIALQGDYVFCFDGKYYQCLPGTIFFIDKNVEHECRYADEAGDVLHIWVYAHKNSTVLHLVSMHQNKLQTLVQAFMQPSTSPDLLELWKLWKEAKEAKKKEYYLQQLKLYLAYAFSVFLLQPERHSKEESKLELINLAMERIKADFNRGIRIENLARMLGYSKFHFMRLFKQYTGQTVMQFVNKCRFEKFRELKKLKKNNKEIAAELGFQDVHSYYKWNRQYNRKK